MILCRNGFYISLFYCRFLWSNIFLIFYSLPGLAMSVASFSVVGSCGETIVSSSALVVGSYVEEARTSIVSSCATTIGLLDVVSCVATSMFGVETLVSFLEQLMVLLIFGYLRCWSGFELQQ